MVRAIWNGEIVAESDDTILVEGNHYFPPDAVKREFLTDSTTETTCSWKGIANYYSLRVANEENRDAAWYYPKLLPEAEKMGFKDYVAFWKGVRIA